MTRTALITGAGRNIGRHLARRFAGAGYQVVVCARTPASVEAVAKEIENEGGVALGVPADVSDPDSVAALVMAATDRFGGVDVLVNNAVARVQRSIEDMTVDEWKLVLGVVLDGAFHCAKAVVPGMKSRGWGRILNMTGTAGMKGSANRLGVVTSKSGLEGFTRGLAREVAPAGITVNAISPGRIDTERGEWTSQGDVSALLGHYERSQKDVPVGRKGTLDEVAALALFLAGDDAAFITGQTVAVNGGIYMR